MTVPPSYLHFPMSNDQQPSRNSFPFLRLSYFLASAFKKTISTRTRNWGQHQFEDALQEHNYTFPVKVQHTHVHHIPHIHKDPRNQIHWTCAEWFTQTKWPQEKSKLFHQHGLKVFQDAQLWILVYRSLNQSASFPLHFWASERLLKAFLKKENSYVAFTWAHQGSIQLSNHPYPLPRLLLHWELQQEQSANRRCSKDIKSTLIHTKRKWNRKNKECFNTWHGPCRSVIIFQLSECKTALCKVSMELKNATSEDSVRSNKIC